MPKQPAIYIMASARNGTLYTGVTTNLRRRVAQHREGQTPGFTLQYRCFILVYYELHTAITAAITREKQLKGGSRFKKLRLIESANPEWQDLYDTLSPTIPTHFRPRAKLPPSRRHNRRHPRHHRAPKSKPPRPNHVRHPKNVAPVPPQ